MARTIQEINESIINNIRSREELDGLTSGSAAAIWRMIVYVVAVAIAAFENMNDAFRAEIQELVSQLRPHTLRWYQQKALDFQLGFDLVDGDVVYDNTGIDPDIVFDSKIVEYASVSERGTTLVIKVAQGTIRPLSASELEAFTAYINEIKDAGIRIEIISVPADVIRGEIDIYYDPTILDSLGRRLDGTFPNPALAAIQGYTQNIRFNGQFFTSFMGDSLQAVDGVEAYYVRRLEIARDGDPNYVTVEATHSPFSGFVRVDQDSDIQFNYIPLES